MLESELCGSDLALKTDLTGVATPGLPQVTTPTKIGGNRYRIAIVPLLRTDHTTLVAGLTPDFDTLPDSSVPPEVWLSALAPERT